MGQPPGEKTLAQLRKIDATGASVGMNEQHGIEELSREPKAFAMLHNYLKEDYQALWEKNQLLWKLEVAVSGDKEGWDSGQR